MQVIPNQLGQAFSTGLQQLAHNKLQEVSQKYEQAQLGKSLKSSGLPDNIINLLMGVDPKTRQALLSTLDLNALEERNEQPQQQNGLAALQHPQQQFNQQQQQDPYQQLLQAAQNFSGPMGQMQQQQGGLGSLFQQPEQQQFGQQGPEQQARGQEPIEKTKQRPLFKSPNENILAREKHEFAKEEAAKKHEAELRPFLQDQHKQYQLARRVSNKAKKALDILEKNKDKLPHRIIGHLPNQVADFLVTNPELRNYTSLLNEIVKDTANVDKGPLTKPKIQLTEAAKANYSQPYETQKAILERLIQAGKDAGDQEKFLANLKDKQTGRHPEDIESRVVEFQQAQDDPLEYPQYYKPGTLIEDNGEEYENVGSISWKPVNRTRK